MDGERALRGAPAAVALTGRLLMSERNLDAETVAGFGAEWSRFDQSGLPEAEARALFERYFGIFPFEELPPDAAGFDLGCGSGRWARFVAPRVGTLHCIDPSAAALAVARRNLADRPGCVFHEAPVDAIPLPDESLDFGYSLGVLHHVPDTAAGIRACVRKLKPGAPFLIYLYYAFDNRPAWFRALWRVSDVLRRGISRLPIGLRHHVADAIAATVYFPLARGAAVLDRLGMGVETLPLASYRTLSFYSMRTDALDRFGTRLEQRFTRAGIRGMLETAGLERIRFSEAPPYWCAVGFRGPGA